MKKIWPFSFYFLYFAAFASLLPFFVLFYQRLGFSGTQIGLLTGVPPLITLAGATLLTGIADSTGRHKLVMSMGMLVPIFVMILMPSLTSFAMVFSFIIIFNIFISPVSPLADSATMSMLGDQRAMYGRIRLGGTLGWGLFAPIAGSLVEDQGLRTAFLAFSLIMFLNFLVSQRFVYSVSAETGAQKPGVGRLLADRKWIYFLLQAFLGGVGALSVASYLFPYMAEMGATETTMGLALTIATVTELPVFFFGHRLVKRFSSHGLFVLSLVLIGLRSLLYGVVNTPALVLVLQALGGTIFPAMWLAGVSYADENAPSGLKSVAQGLFGSVMWGFGSAVGGFLGGPLLESIGGRGMFLVLGLVILAGLGIIELAKRILPEASPPAAA